MQKARPAPSHVEERHGGMEARSRMVLRRPKAKAAELQIGDCKLQIANWGTGFAGLMASCCHSLAAPILAPLSRAPAGERVQQRVLMDHDAAAAKRSRKRSPSGARLFLFARLMPASPSAPSPGTPGEGWGEGDLEFRCRWYPKSPSPLPSPGVPGEGVSCSPLRALTARRGVAAAPTGRESTAKRRPRIRAPCGAAAKRGDDIDSNRRSDSARWTCSCRNPYCRHRQP